MRFFYQGGVFEALCMKNRFVFPIGFGFPGLVGFWASPFSIGFAFISV